MPLQFPNGIDPIVKISYRLTTQYGMSGSVQNGNSFAARGRVQIQAIESHLVHLSVRKVHVEGKTGICIESGCDPVG